MWVNITLTCAFCINTLICYVYALIFNNSKYNAFKPNYLHLLPIDFK